MKKKRLTGEECGNDAGVEISAVAGRRLAALHLDEVSDPTKNPLTDELIKFDLAGSNVGDNFTRGKTRGKVRTPRGNEFVAN